MVEIQIADYNSAGEVLELPSEDKEVIEMEVKDISPMRIDKYLSEELKDFTRSRIQKLISDGMVEIDGKVISASNVKCKSGNKIRVHVPMPEETDILPENIPLDIVYEDEGLIIVNKPQGMVVHPSSGHTKGTLVNALMYKFGDNLSGINGELRPGIVHRIDMNTSGILCICKNDKTHNYMAELLGKHDIHRVYYCLCNGIFKDKYGRIEAPIGRSLYDRKKMAINLKGKNAITNYEVIAEFKNRYSLVKCQLETGRTHQIRVHMASKQHPIVGDDVYNTLKKDYKLNGQLLHAAELGFIHPVTGRYIEFRTPLPDYFMNILDGFNECTVIVSELNDALKKRVNYQMITEGTND